MGPGASTLTLTPASVATIHHHGGTVLGSSRGGFDCDRIIAWLRAHGINQLYVVGGDGSQCGAQRLFEATRTRVRAAASPRARRVSPSSHRRSPPQRLPIAIIGVPKTIDNDIDLMDRSFGFNTAVQEAQLAIRVRSPLRRQPLAAVHSSLIPVRAQSAKVEASCAPNGIGVVKLMGRHAGFIAAHATLASGDVDLCLIPEVPILLRGKLGCLPHLERILERRGHAVVVVAEGAGEDLLAQQCGTSYDESGNKALPPIGPFMKEQIKAYFTERGCDVTVKYIDPSYMIRSVPPNASDSLFCMLLAQNAVHGAMAGGCPRRTLRRPCPWTSRHLSYFPAAGFTGFVTALCNNRVVYLPITDVVENSPRCMDPFGRCAPRCSHAVLPSHAATHPGLPYRTWERILSVTCQPETADTLRKGRMKRSKSFSAKTVF